MHGLSHLLSVFHREQSQALLVQGLHWIHQSGTKFLRPLGANCLTHWWLGGGVLLHCIEHDVVWNLFVKLSALNSSNSSLYSSNHLIWAWDTNEYPNQKENNTLFYMMEIHKILHCKVTGGAWVFKARRDDILIFFSTIKGASPQNIHSIVPCPSFLPYLYPIYFSIFYFSRSKTQCSPSLSWLEAFSFPIRHSWELWL